MRTATKTSIHGYVFRLALPTLLIVCLSAPPALAQTTILELARQRLEQIRDRVGNLTPEEIAQLKAARAAEIDKKSTPQVNTENPVQTGRLQG